MLGVYGYKSLELHLTSLNLTRPNTRVCMYFTKMSSYAAHYIVAVSKSETSPLLLACIEEAG